MKVTHRRIALVGSMAGVSLITPYVARVVAKRVPKSWFARFVNKAVGSQGGNS